MFHKKIHRIPVEEIESGNRLFEFTTSHTTGALAESIARTGILNPLWVRGENKSFVILSGFKRFDAARGLGLEEIPARIFCETVPVERAFRAVLEERLLLQPLNVIETTKILEIVQKFGCSLHEIPKEFLSLLDIPNNPRLLKKYLDLLALSESAQSYISRRNLSLKQTGIFRGFTGDEQDSVIHLADSLRLNSHELGIICTHLHDLSQRENTTVTAVRESLGLDAILHDPLIDRNKKREMIRGKLTEERFPLLTKNRLRLDQELGRLSFASKGRWSWDPSFERPGLVYQAGIVMPKDIRDIVDDFSREENRKILVELLTRI